jgi:hypothetical protein
VVAEEQVEHEELHTSQALVMEEYTVIPEGQVCTHTLLYLDRMLDPEQLVQVVEVPVHSLQLGSHCWQV